MQSSYFCGVFKWRRKMSDPMLLAAMFSAVAAAAAAYTAWRGPQSAARLAEKLRRDAEAGADARRFRLNVFASLMQERAEIWSDDGVRALNSIDVAFSTSDSVREAWAELYQVLHTQPSHSDHDRNEKLRALLRAMAIDLGIADKLKADDFARIYFPNALAESRAVRRLEQQAALARLTGTSAAAGTSEDGAPGWPPKPE
jgi:hypothetical protein